MKGQMSIFDFLPQQTEHPDFHNMTEVEMVDYVGKVIGVNFTYDDFFEQYRATIKGVKKKVVLDIDYDHYANSWMHDRADGKLFISVGYNYSHGGGGGPCDSIKEAIDYFNTTIKRIKDGFYEMQSMEDDE